MKTKQIIRKLRQWNPSSKDMPPITEAANRLEMLSVELKKLQRNRAAMKEELIWAINYLHDGGGCAGCKHEDKQETSEPCQSCNRYAGTEEKWEWHFAKDTDAPGKTATDTNVGHNEEG